MLQDGRDERRRRVGRERALPGHHLVQDRAKRENVGARVGRMPLDLLGGHVRQRADDRARGDFYPDAQRLVEVQRSTLEPVCERFSLEVLHDDEIGARFAPYAMEHADVRMVQRRHRFGLAFEPRDGG